MENKLPYYMAYPMPLVYDDERRERMDFEYMKSMYPDAAKKLLPYIEDECDRMEFEGSMIYDEYPDRWQMYKLSQDILDRIRRQEEKENPDKEIPKEKWEWASDLVQIILFYEVYKRRHNNHNGILKF